MMIGNDRRAYPRYAIKLDLHYTVYEDPKSRPGSGATRDISSGGIAFRADTVLGDGEAVEINIAWPVLREAEHPIRLKMYGRVLRSHEGETAVRIFRHEFITFGKRQRSAAPR